MTDKLRFTATIHGQTPAENKTFMLCGRDAWALLQLVEAGANGCTPIDNPAPRWSHYVWLLRGHGFLVETIHEEHQGPFSGTHARYLLHGRVTIEGGNLPAWRPQGVKYGPLPQEVAA